MLYVEQAAAEARDQPYRQRLYVVEAAADDPRAARSRVFELADPARAVGLCAGTSALPEIATGAQERAGCAVTLSWDAARGAFTGSTHGRDCASTLRGAAYATSEVTLEAGRLVSWDRGFDAAGEQVWGAVTGPYVFVRRGGPLPGR